MTALAIPLSPARGGVRPGTRRLIAGCIIVGFVTAVGWMAPQFLPAGPSDQDLANRLSGPSADHWFGTDQLGRDVFTRVIYAARLDIPLALAGASISATIGVSIGAVAGYVGGLVSSILMRLADFVQAFPSYVFMVTLAFIVGPGVKPYLIAAAALGWVSYARIVRAEVLRIRELDFARAARSAGLGHRRVLFGHILPNSIPQAIVYLSSDIVLALIALASLSYLGLGVQPPTPEWGSMIAEGQRYVSDEWWLSALPGVAVVVVGFGFVLISSGLAQSLGNES